VHQENRAFERGIRRAEEVGIDRGEQIGHHLGLADDRQASQLGVRCGMIVGKDQPP
jgi:hypothetical protein